MWWHIFDVLLSSYNQSDPWLICIRSIIIEGLKCFIQASLGSIPFVKIITAYSLNCSLQNADMHGYELFMAMDENRDWKLNFFQAVNVSKPCSQDWISVWFNDWTYNWMFGHSLVHTFKCSAVQTFSCSDVQLFRRSVEHRFRRSTVQTFNCSNVQLNKRSDVQTFRRSDVQLFRRINSLSIEQAVNRMNEQSFKWPLMNYFWLWMTIWIKI